MKFMITFNHIEGVWEGLSEGERAQHMAELRTFAADLAQEKQSHMVFLSPALDARTIRKHPDGRLSVDEGPSVQGPEQAGGYYIIEADDWDEAVEWARRGRMVVGSNEVRQILEMSF